MDSLVEAGNPPERWRKNIIETICLTFTNEPHFAYTIGENRTRKTHSIFIPWVGHGQDFCKKNRQSGAFQNGAGSDQGSGNCLKKEEPG